MVLCQRTRKKDKKHKDKKEKKEKKRKRREDGDRLDGDERDYRRSHSPPRRNYDEDREGMGRNDRAPHRSRSPLQRSYREDRNGVDYAGGVTTIDRIRLLNENIADATPALRRHEIIVMNTRDGEAKVRDVRMVTPPLPKSEQHALQPCHRMPAC